MLPSRYGMVSSQGLLWLLLAFWRRRKEENERQQRERRNETKQKSLAPGAYTLVLSYPCAGCNLQLNREESAQLEARDGCAGRPGHGQKTVSSPGSRGSALQAHSLACLVGETSGRLTGEEPLLVFLELLVV